jgi:hypothetical protein
MRHVEISELSKEEADNIDNYLKRNLKSSPIDGMFWLELSRDMYGPSQKGHDDCGPFYMGVELSRDSVCFELLVRSKTNLHCSCISYATNEQRQHLIDFIDRMIEEEKIKA